MAITSELVISGFGGQGTLFAGQIVAYAGMDAGRHVTWIPSYGPEMRGGKARCTVVVSDEEIGSPIVRRPTSAIVMNIPSMEAYEPAVTPGGVLIVNSSLIDLTSERKDIAVIYVPATERATDMGNVRVANMILLGAWAAATGVLTPEQLGQALADHLPEGRQKLVPINREALRRGAEVARGQLELAYVSVPVSGSRKP
jgi:2-oxoglutarate ferredoxin oxidoreductase subunit gamma